MPREGGASSTLRLPCSIAAVSGILGHPPSRVTTSECEFAISRHALSEVCIFVCPSFNQRAQGRPGARCTRGLACQLRKQKCTRAYKFSGNTPAFPAQWLYGLLRTLPGERLFCHRRRANLARLDASTAASGPHDFAVRFTPPSSVMASASTATCPNVRDDGRRPSSGQDGDSLVLICPTG